jgi:hypothetical protein
VVALGLAFFMKIADTRVRRFAGAADPGIDQLHSWYTEAFEACTSTVGLLIGADGLFNEEWLKPVIAFTGENHRSPAGLVQKQLNGFSTESGVCEAALKTHGEINVYRLGRSGRNAPFHPLVSVRVRVRPCVS